MAPAPDRRSSTGIDRRASMPLAMAHPADDDYDLESAGVADGFRPTEAVANHARIPSIITTNHHHDQPQGRRSPPPRPSSTAKPARNSFTLRHDGAMGPVASRNPTAASASGALPNRSSSVSSISTDATFVRAESPYRGPAGPSHPYQTYSQGAPLTRTPSTMTTSTIRVPERAYEGPNGPTHPYGMYPQNTVPESEASSTRSAPVLVGFPGLNNTYQRRLGPDGEEVADIIGPDGHTEQLPPYTKYPDEAFARKARSATPPPILPPPPGAGGMGLATRDPEFSSQEDLNAPPSRRSTRSMLSDSTDHSDHSNGTSPTSPTSSAHAPFASESEKPQLKRWQRVARKRICGIFPVWALGLVGVTLILFVVILLAVLASLWHKHSMKQHHISNDGSGPPSNGTSASPSLATTIDASPFISLPTNIPRLPTGTFQLPISTPSVSPSQCLPWEQNSAWSCNISPLVMPYELKVSPIGGSNLLSNNEVLLGMGNNSITSFAYGAQPPTLHHPQVLNLALDKYDPSRGPAWYFQTLLYNKVVVVRENELTAPNSHSKRDVSRPERDTPGLQQKTVPQPGERPWFCYWNNTLLEAFIYVNDTSTAACALPATTTSIASTTTSAPSSQTTSLPPYALPSPVFMPCYPKIVKLEERRISQEDSTPQPYCVQHYITGDGAALPYLDGNGKPVTIQLNETEPPIPPPLVRRSPTFDDAEGFRPNVDERSSTASCGCAWLSE